MSEDIVLDDWVLPESIGVPRNHGKAYEINREKLEENIQKNREAIKRMRCDEKYEKNLQKV